MSQNSSKMVKRKVAKRKPSIKKKVVRAPAKAAASKDPEFMIQINDPVMLRKDVLESLREIILFMQGYEKFRALQDEKTSLFLKLKGDLKDLNMLEGKLRKLLPKGKLQAVTGQMKKQQQREVESFEEEEKIPLQVVPVSSSPVTHQVTSDLDQLEAQLRDIEGQLHGLK